jgi:hypothetical protein
MDDFLEGVHYISILSFVLLRAQWTVTQNAIYQIFYIFYTSRVVSFFRLLKCFPERDVWFPVGITSEVLVFKAILQQHLTLQQWREYREHPRSIKVMPAARVHTLPNESAQSSKPECEWHWLQETLIVLSLIHKTRHFGDWILSPSLGGTYSDRPNRKSWSLSPETESSLRNILFLNKRQDDG